jgi:hypothetical protein
MGLPLRKESLPGRREVRVGAGSQLEIIRLPSAEPVETPFPYLLGKSWDEGVRIGFKA